MTDTVEDDVRAAFARITEPVVPGPDPFGRLLARRRRSRWRRGLTAAAAAVALAVGGGTLAAVPVGNPIGPSPGPDRSDANEPSWPKARMDAWTRRLVEAPTRGDLAGDKAYVSALTEAMATGGHPMADKSLDRVKVLVVTDVAGIRVAVTAFYNDEFGSFSVSQAAVGATPEDLAFSQLGGMAAALRPFFVATSQVSRGPDLVEHQAAFALTPAGCTLDSSDTVTMGADGRAQRTWVPRGDHVIEAGELFHLWWRVTCDGRVRFEGPTTFPGPVLEAGADGLAAYGGTAHPRVIGAAVDGWRAATRHLGGTAPRVLWAGPTGEGRTAVVVAGPGRDGRQLVTALMDPGADVGGPGLDTDARMITHDPAVYYTGRRPYFGEPGPEQGSRHYIPTVFGTATAASTDLVIVRLPGESSPPVLGGRLLVVAPPSATQLLVNGLAGTGSLPLTGGAGVLTAPAPLDGHTMFATDASGTVVATARYGEPDANGQFFGERVVDDWTT